MQTLTISSKNQITIPAALSRLMKLKKGQTLLIKKRAESLVLTPSELVVRKLSGSIRPKKRIKDMDKIIIKAKKSHFLSKNHSK